ncbi:Similar to ORC3: Origin recognition complex subunit 3 (Spermophilus citellus) [Cotesia congregata]|uniref:Similar to ORC3: Origin recognition complex subunit 3 (Spermophilus citellus) n=1 Tax=Cotesia congregata TaxID=51543 RepID=A0A8J2H429_COTCN|nr:Similar to ORC3: Origin recognition complex subunit 3 (Spermophilus citellus) [Cotesia congregata]
MDDVSVSKGIFAHPGRYTIGSNRKRSKSVSNCKFSEPWYLAYEQVWSTIKNCAEEINTDMFKQILTDIKKYMSDIKENNSSDFLNEIPTAILLTGINLPDHDELFRKLALQISGITNYIAVVQSRDSASIKSLTEDMVFQLINGSDQVPIVKKSQCTLRVLEAWYKEQCTDTPLVIVIPDFESFNPIILHDFILVLRRTMKFVLIFGVATTLHAVHRSLPYDATSKLRVQVFYTQTQVKSLSDILEGTVFSGKTPFMLTGRAFQLLTDIFLFYDFSVDSFLQGYKLCMFQHFFGNNLTSLCCNRKTIDQAIGKLSTEDLDDIRRLPSVVKYTEKHKIKGKEDMDDESLKWLVGKFLQQFHDSTSGFFIILKCLHYLVSSLPGSPLGKQLREIYATAVTCDLTETQEYKECIKLLNFLSKSELVTKLEKIIKIIEDNHTEEINFNGVIENLKMHLEKIKAASLEISSEVTPVATPTMKISRTSFRENLLNKAQKSSKSEFKQAQLNLMNYLNDDLFMEYLKNPNRLPCSEIFCFSDANAGKHHLRVRLLQIRNRANDSTDVTRPQHYLQAAFGVKEIDQYV